MVPTPVPPPSPSATPKSLVRVAVSLKGISKSQFDSVAKTHFKQVVSGASTENLCGESTAKRSCNESDVILTQITRRSLKLDLDFDMRRATDAEKWVAAHNKVRCMHGSPDVVWSSDVAASAQLWANSLSSMQHSDSYSIAPPAGPAGENLAMGYGSLEQVVTGWWDEHQVCSQGYPGGCQTGPSCSESSQCTGSYCSQGKCATGHFTALIWKGVTKIGCGINAAKKIYVCRYWSGDSKSCNTANMGGCYPENVLQPTKTEAQCTNGAASTPTTPMAPSGAGVYSSPSEMVCKSGGSWTRPSGDVPNSAAGVVDCAAKCAGYTYFGLECPRDTVHCQCANTLAGSTSEGVNSCQSGIGGTNHCVGPYTQAGYNMGGPARGSVYLVNPAVQTDTYTCQVGQTQSSGPYIQRSGANSESACAAACDAAISCVAFDFTTNTKQDACRLVASGQTSRTNGGGDNRQYCMRSTSPTSSPTSSPTATGVSSPSTLVKLSITVADKDSATVQSLLLKNFMKSPNFQSSLEAKGGVFTNLSAVQGTVMTGACIDDETLISIACDADPVYCGVGKMFGDMRTCASAMAFVPKLPCDGALVPGITLRDACCSSCAATNATAVGAPDDADEGLSGGAIAAIVICAALFLICIAAGIAWYFYAHPCKPSEAEGLAAKDDNKDAVAEDEVVGKDEVIEMEEDPKPTANFNPKPTANFKEARASDDTSWQKKWHIDDDS